MFTVKSEVVGQTSAVSDDLQTEGQHFTISGLSCEFLQMSLFYSNTTKMAMDFSITLYE
jgi:hypothetical protein